MARIKKNSKNNMNWFERNPRVTIFVVLMFSFFLMLFIAELILSFRIEENWAKNIPLNDRNIELREYKPMLDTYVYPTDEYCKMMNPENLIKQKYRFRTDKNGFIMPSEIYPNPDLTIAFLGGSTTECLFVQEKTRFQNLSCRLLEEKRRKKTNSYNLGVSGMNSMMSINILINKLLPLKPDYVILMHNINDITTLTYTGSYWNKSNRELITEKEKISFWKKVRRIIFKIIPHIYTGIEKLTKRQNIDEWADYREKTYRIDTEKILTLYKNSLNTFINICKSWNIKPVLMTQPNRFLINKKPKAFLARWNFDYNDFYFTFNAMNNVIRKAAMQNNIILIDLEKEVPKDSLYIYDVVHLNDNGSILTSKIIANILDNNLK